MGDNSLFEEKRFQGTSIVSGISIGKANFLSKTEACISELTLPQEEVEHEINRYYRALKNSGSDIAALKEQNKGEQGYAEVSAILQAHLEIIKDPLITEEVVDTIRKDRKNAEYVLSSVIDRIEEKMVSSHKGSVIVERLQDIQDVSNRIIGHLCSNRKDDIGEVGQNYIIFSRELIPSDIAGANSSYIRAFVSSRGSATSHAAIVARAKGIPYVAGIPLVSWEAMERYHGSMVIVDAVDGEVIFDPRPATLESYYEKKRLWEEARGVDRCSADVTHTHLKISANIECMQTLRLLQKSFPQVAVGLFRSEFPVLENINNFSFYKQLQLYKLLASHKASTPSVLRLFDFGGDKVYEGFLGSETERSLRWLMRHPEVLNVQLKAALLATASGPLRILIPWVSDISEFRFIKDRMLELIEDCQQEEPECSLQKISLGCMVEVPSMIFLMEEFVQESDFFAIGTNDLSRNALIIDRECMNYPHLEAPLHPAVIRMISRVVKLAKSANKAVCVCGEVASDPVFIPLLVGLGVQEVSVSLSAIDEIRSVVSKIDLVECQRLAEKALEAVCVEDLPELFQKKIRA
ncbi:phosphoenolpyruvate--protein phosphotransferase [Chlamydiifrater phoenicopteri]|uniref:phosphoenolpyruvate--protein phosphotransferase n=1 Tax=Chlamydiifrater phoenicopteri TaxID=2681469 RepID=UPI001BCAB926|nr:phosphoenolpyruvate--protein phosphotransferase [Chlamydiifrater phoenicopteri]